MTTRFAPVVGAIFIGIALLLLTMPTTSSATTSLPDDYGTGSNASSVYCPKLTSTIQKGSLDAATGGQVSELQAFLTDYYNLDENIVVGGYFGKLTQQYLVKFQQEQGLPVFGIVGQLTRAKIAQVCGGTISTSVATPVCSTTPAPVCPAGQHLVGDPTTYDSHNCAVVHYHCTGDTAVGTTVIPTGAFDSTSVASAAPHPTITGTANVSAVTVALKGYTGGSSAVVDGRWSITVIDALPSGTYLLQLTSNTDNRVLAQAMLTVTVPAAPPTQTNPVTVSSFTASQSSVTAGQSVTFSWASNLAATDSSYYGGGCSVSSPDNNNASINTNYGGTGTVTYTPKTTATYTLTCMAGAKDGSPVATKNVTVTVTPGPGQTCHQVTTCTNTGAAVGGTVCTTQNVCTTNPQLAATCTGSPYNAGTPGVSWTTQPTGGNGSYTYQWTLAGDNTGTGIIGTSADLQQQSLLATYGSTGAKNASVVVNSGGQSVTANCSATITAPPAQTNPIVISKFTVSSKSITAGQTVTFNWMSNLSATDISNWGGNCSLYSADNNNVVLNTNTGGSGSVTLTPKASGTYNLSCVSAAKNAASFDSTTTAITVTAAPAPVCHQVTTCTNTGAAVGGTVCTTQNVCTTSEANHQSQLASVLAALQELLKAYTLQFTH